MKCLKVMGLRWMWWIDSGEARLNSKKLVQQKRNMKNANVFE